MSFRIFLCVGFVGLSSLNAQQNPAPATPAGYEQLNEIFGVPIWSDEGLWDDSPDVVATRLQWPEESRTTTDASYRLYPKKEVRVLGSRPFSLALYAVEDKPSQISMVFANKGDAWELAGLREPGPGEPSKQTPNDYKKLIQKDAEEIQKRLTTVLGPPQNDRVGTGRETREQVKRWDWQGHSILLAAPRDEYVAVRILPTASLDAGPAARITDAAMKERLKARIEKRENGDVILKDIPMVDQGPKGYCVPATWERALRYTGIPADMYILAMAGKTEAGGGTSVGAIAAGASELVVKNGRRLSAEAGRVQVRNVAKYIDQGLPIMWAMFSEQDVNRMISDRSAQRQTTSDWQAWEKLLDPYRKQARRIQTHRDRGHVCMIIGYNEKTGEIAVSDSWGKNFAERWMTQEEADAISGNSFMVINW